MNNQNKLDVQSFIVTCINSKYVIHKDKLKIAQHCHKNSQSLSFQHNLFIYIIYMLNGNVLHKALTHL